MTIHRVVAISTLAPALFTDAPYNFSSAQIGLFFISGFIGISVAYPIAGPLTDIFSGWMCARNNNIHKPEHRIPALLVPFLICPPGLIVFGCTIANNQSYVYPAIGTAMSSAALTMVPSVMLSYVVESYPLMSGEGLVLINTTKNVVAFGISESANSWLESDGQEVLFENLAAIQWAVLSLALPLFFLGPWIRSKTGGILA